MPTQEIATVDGTALVTMDSAPDVVLAEASKAATALQKVLASKPKKVTMNGEQYLEFEDWQTVGRFYGVTAKEDGDPELVTIPDDYGKAVRGFKASAVALDRTGRVLSRATAYCLSDEEKWGNRPKYVWAYVKKSGGTSVEDPGYNEIVWEDNPNKPGKKLPKKERVLDGSARVPLFQLASMAQTRAAAKALRNVLSWVVVMAGYRPTPAEEIDGQTKTVDVEDAEVVEAVKAEGPSQSTLEADGTAGCPTCGTVVGPWRNAGKDGSHFCSSCRKPFLATAKTAEEVPA